MMIPKEQIKKALDKAFDKVKESGNAYFGNGFAMGVEFALEYLRECESGIEINDDVKNKPLIEQKCDVEVEYVDVDGVTRIATIEHDGEEDSWDSIELVEENLCFDFNTFGGKFFCDSKDAFRINAYQTGQQNEDGVWIMDLNKEIECKIIKITPKE